MTMTWEKVQQKGGNSGPGVRWGHTCNSVAGGKLLYVFGGYGKDQCQTNQVHVFNTGLFVPFAAIYLFFFFLISDVNILGVSENLG